MAIEVHELVHIEDMAAARDLIVVALKSDSCKVKVENNNRLTAKRGSQIKMRALGGAFVNLKVLPVRLEVDFVEIENQGQVEIFASSDFGLGSMLGMEEKYRAAVLDLADIVIGALGPVKAKAKPNGVNIETSKPGKVFCSQCGNKIEENSKFCSSCGGQVT